MQQIARKRYKRSTGHSRSHFCSYIAACITCTAYESSFLFLLPDRYPTFVRNSDLSCLMEIWWWWSLLLSRIVWVISWLVLSRVANRAYSVLFSDSMLLNWRMLRILRLLYWYLCPLIYRVEKCCLSTAIKCIYCRVQIIRNRGNVDSFVRLTKNANTYDLTPQKFV